MVTPFDSNGELDEDAAARLIRHLLENGSDGLVLAGSTGEAATMTDEEKVRLWEIGVAESGDAPIIAGTGTYDTRHSVELTERAHEAGVDAMLVVTPYYVRPNRRGIKAHYEAVAAATDRPIVAYNIPSRTATDMPNDLLAELAADNDNVTAVKQARYEDLAPIEGMDLLAGNDDVFADVMDMGGTGIISVASNLIGAEMRRIVDEPERRQEIQDGLRDLLQGADRDHEPDPGQDGDEHGRPRGRAAAAAARRGVGGGAGGHPRGARAPQAARRGLTNGTLRVLPLGGLGEIGKNMMVVEYGGRIVVVDTGLMFPAPDQLGIDLVLPDFTYLRERADDIDAIVLTHGHEDHVGALPFLLRELDRAPTVYGGPLTAAMVRSKLDEHRLKDVQRRGRARRPDLRRRPVLGGDGEDGPLDPRRVRRGAHHRARHDADDRRLQVRPDAGGRRPGRRLTARRAGPRGLLLLCGDSTNADRPGMSLSESSVGPRLEEVFARCQGRIIVTCFASNIHRVQQVVDAAATARPARLPDRPLDAQEHEHRAACSATSTSRGDAGRAEGDRGLPGPQARDHLDGLAGRAAVGPAPHGARRPPERGPA